MYPTERVAVEALAEAWEHEEASTGETDDGDGSAAIDEDSGVAVDGPSSGH